MTVYLTVREVAELAQCEHKSVRRAIRQGRLQAFRPANKILIREDDAETWIQDTPASIEQAASRASSLQRQLGSRKASQRPGSVAELRELERKAVST
jgi:excisionase family DNA binding protein